MNYNQLLTKKPTKKRAKECLEAFNLFYQQENEEIENKKITALMMQ